MQISAEKLIAPAVLIAATSIPGWYEVPFGAFGLSVEHILLLMYFGVILFRIHSRTELEFTLVAMIFFTTAIVGSAMVHTSNAHLGSLVILSLMFPLFIKYFQIVDKPNNLVGIAFALIAFQCIFFSHESLQFGEEWDYLVIPGFGLVPRLAILGFVSNSLGLMLFPFYAYFLHQAHMSHDRKVINYLFAFIAFAIILLTFSRTAILLIFISIFILFKLRALVIVLITSTLIFIINPYEIINLFEGGFLRDVDLSQNSRVQVWLLAISNWSGSEILTGRGLQNPPLDNTYLSIVTGAGLLGIIALLGFFFVFARWLFKLKRNLPHSQFYTVAFVIIGILVSANTYDIFSQRKIIFGCSFIIAALLSKHARNLHF